jgi:putative nucleotide binding protein
MQRRFRHPGARRPRRRPYREEYGYVLDYLPMGNPTDRHPWHRSRPVVQLIGEDYFTLMEATPRPGVQLEIGERVYVGPVSEERLKIEKVDNDIEYEDLTSVARDVLPQVVEEIVKRKEPLFVEFFNIAEPLSLRFHSLELLPGVGKRTLKRILEYREKKPFESFEEIREQAHIDPVKALVERIIEELKGGQKYYLFVRPPRREREQPVPPLFLDYLSKAARRLRERAGRSEAQA